MISELIRLVMHEFGLSQAALADLMGVNVQRVKNLSVGLVKKLTREEGEALIKKLNIRAEWLVTGEGPMLRTPDEQEFQRRLDVLKLASQQAAAVGMTQEQADLLQQGMQASQLLSPYGLSADEAALLDAYRRSPPEAQAVVLRALGVAVTEKPAKPLVRPSAHEFSPSGDSKSRPRFIGEEPESSNRKRKK